MQYGTATWGLSIGCLACACLSQWSSWGGGWLLQELEWDDLPWSASAAGFRRAALPPSSVEASYPLSSPPASPSCFSSDLDNHPEFILSGPSPSANYIFPQWMPTKVVNGLQHMGTRAVKDSLRKLDLLSLENGSGAIPVSLRSRCQGGRFPEAHRERTRGNRCRSQQGKQVLDKDKHYSLW